MKMPQDNPASLRASIVAAGNLSSRILVGLESKASWAELVHGSILESAIAELRGKSVLLATVDQFRASAALIELDGVARRIVLFPPDVPREHLAYVAKTAESDVLITDQSEIASAHHGIGHVIRCTRDVHPVNHDRGSQVEPVSKIRFVSGHDFSRAENEPQGQRVLTPVGLQPTARRPFSKHALETEWILLTSGTTGIPKLAQHTLASLAGSARHTDPSSASIVWSTFYDMRRYGGLHIFLHAALTGTSLVVSSAQEPTADFLARAAAHGVNHISGTPSHWRRALMSPWAGRIAPEYVRMSGEIVDQSILNQVQSQYPQARVAHTFASTEAGVGFNVNDGLMGFPAETLVSNPEIEMKVKDGTLRIRSTRTAFRYLGADAPVLKDAEGFVDTGDTLELREGRYCFTGRRDGTINVGGFKVHPEEVEAVINRHPDVVMSLVKAKKNPITGALVVADVVLKSPSLGESGTAALQRNILQFCRGELAPHKVPAAIDFVPMLTIGESGKLVRRHA